MDDEILEQETADTQKLLDAGYDELDRYSRWIETHRKTDNRTAERYSYVLESLVDYLANYRKTDFRSMSEYDVTWFSYFYFIRQSTPDAAMHEALIAALSSFTEWMKYEYEWVAPSWLNALNADATMYNRRLASYRSLENMSESDWTEAFEIWCAELNDYLDSRCMLVPTEIANGIGWGGTMGWREKALYDHCARRWQHERDKRVNGGAGYEEVRRSLLGSYASWLETPQERLDMASPRDVIMLERMDNDTTEDEEEDD